MGALRDWPCFMQLADAAADAAAYREQGLEDAEDELKTETENPHNNTPSGFSGSHDEQPKTLTSDESVSQKPIYITLFGTDIYCFQESQDDQQVSRTNLPQPCPKKQEERVDGLKRRSESSESSSPKKPKKKDTCRPSHHQAVPDLPETVKEMIQGMEGSGEKLILQKKLYSTDLSDHHGRLSLPLNQVMAEFLNDEEKNVLVQGSKRSIEALVIEPCLKKRNMKSKRWEMKKKNGKPSSVMYVFTCGWNSVVRDNDLKEGDVMQIWSFRANAKLCFALVILDPSLVEGGR
ncbi:hypothetical protein V6N13_094087 [Hibiscus sabdariffa]|uniref:TF-B3 domain-containing protein n=2 Tax=Hibiscus sabdariffa TaxID=183260 RepID=A0ABR1Z5J9_9ROSI